MKLKGELMVWIIKMQVRVQSCFFHCFCCFSLFFTIFNIYFSLVLEIEIVQEWKTFCGLRILLKTHPSLHFLSHR
jgi:hypothetical protein